MFLNHFIKVFLLLLFTFIQCNAFAQDSVDTEKSLTSKYADKMINPDYKYNKSDNVKESLTTSYINSMRVGKWGASDPDWVNLDFAKTFFPDATT
ncbi:MAG TPA: hypothetical protein EYQ51_04605 [Alphaproteobacteria bacterium]|nr:hypothetical protein [Alphaproteobacteria bacterium]